MTTRAASPECTVEPQHPASAGRSRTGWLLAWLAVLPVAVFRAGTMAEGDTFWEIRTGLITIGHRAIPRVDPFSWTVHGKPWTENSWGFDVVVAFAYRVAGLPGVAWICAGLAIAVAGLVLLLARQLGASPLVAGPVLMSGAALLIAWLSARPQLVDYCAFLVLVVLLRRIAEGTSRVPSVLLVGLLSIVWVNLHAAALLAVAITGVCAVLLHTRSATRAGGWWCVAAGAAALAGSLVNPYGPGVLTQTQHVQSVSAGLVVEWAHFDVGSPVQPVMLALGLVALVLATRRRDAVIAGALGALAAGSVVAIRFLPFLVLLALPVLAASISSVSNPALLRYVRSRRAMFYRCGTAGWLAVGVIAALSVTHIGRPDPALYPTKIVHAISAGCRLFTTDTLGDFVILERPDVPVSLDSRFDLYGRRRILADQWTLRGRGDLSSELAGAGCVLVPPAYGLANRLHRDSAWQAATSNPAAALFVRRPAQPGAPS